MALFRLIFVFFLLGVVVRGGVDTERAQDLRARLHGFHEKLSSEEGSSGEKLSTRLKNLHTSKQLQSQNNKWIVVTSIQSPTEAVRVMANLHNWTVVVVGDKKSPNTPYLVENVVFLSVEEQERLGYFPLPYNSYARKMVGYLYAIQHGAQVIYESDDDNMPLSKLEWFLGPHQEILHYSKVGVEHEEYPVVNPYSHFGHPSIWPRGYPLEALNIDQEELYIPAVADTWIQQSLANGDPDVDAIFRLTRKIHDKPIDIVFDPSAPAVALPEGVYCPYNSQNTLHHYSAFWALFIPGSVTFRVSDIWRSYWAQRLLWEVGGVVSFLPAMVYQERNAHNYLKDFTEEDQLYKQAGELVKFLNAWKPNPKYTQFVDVILQLSTEMAQQGFWGKTDVDLVRAWCSQLQSLGYQFPPLRKAPPLTNKPIQLRHVVERVQDSNGISHLQTGDNPDSRQRVFLFICILVAPEQLDLRTVLRETYLTFLKHMPEVLVAYRFFTDYKNNEQQLELFKEQEEFGDLHISNSMHCTHRGGHCHNSMNLVTDALGWTLENYDFTYFLRLDSDGYLCLPQLLHVLQDRPQERYITGFYGCRLGKVNSFFRADEAFLLFTQDIARMYIDNLPLIRQNPSTTFALNFGAFTLWLNIVMEDIPWGPEIKNVCHPFLFIHKQKDPNDIRKSHAAALDKLEKGLVDRPYQPLCEVERVKAGKPEVVIKDKFWGEQHVDARKHWLEA